MRGRRLRPLFPAVAAVVGVVLATLVVAALEHSLGVPNAAAVYLVAVSAVAIAAGTGGAVLAALLAVLVYDYLFTNPLHTFSVSDPGELLNLLLLLFVAVVVGQLASLQRGRAEVAEAREREARSLVEVATLLASRVTVAGALPAIAAVLGREPGTERCWISLGGDDASERTVADTGTGEPPRRTGAYSVLHRGPAGRPPAWTLIREAGGREAGAEPGLARQAGPGPQRERRFRARIESAGRILGSIWVVRPDPAGAPGASATRLLAVTADQIGQALEHDRLEAEARLAEIARESDQLKSALLASVSHDLRTPLASIRAFAGTLMDADVQLDRDETRTSAAAIDREAQRLNRIVANLLDLSRLEGGALQARREVLDLEDVVERAAAQVRPRLGGRSLRLSIPADLAVSADPVLLDEALVNLLENAATHTPDGTRVEVSARSQPPGVVRLTVEDSGPGVPTEALAHLFEKFYQVRPARMPTARSLGVGGRGPVAAPSDETGRRRGTGIGLAVVRGLTEALGGRVAARPSSLGGLAIDLDLPAATPAPIPEEVAG